MRFADLEPGDVLWRGSNPIFMVLRCDHTANVFVWMPLVTHSVGEVFTPNFEVSDYWSYDVFEQYTSVTRAGNDLTR